MIKVALAGLLGRKLRTALTAIAIVLGVAMISGTFVLTDSIDKAFNSIFTDVRKGSTVVVSGKSAFDISQGQGSFAPTIERVRARARCAPCPVSLRVEGSVNGEALLVDQKGKAIVFGGAPNLGFSIANPQSPFNVLRLEQGAWPHGNEVVIGKSTADRKHFHVGDTIGVQAEGPVQKLKISGLVTFGSAASLGGATLAGFDLPTAQRLFDKQGKLDEIAVAGNPRVADSEILRRVKAVLPSTAQARLGTAQAAKDAKDTNSFITFLRGFLLAFGGIALFVGSFVIANSLSITIAQRTRELATMRTLGASRRQVLTSIIVEALVIGFAASVVGSLPGARARQGALQALRRRRVHAAEQRPHLRDAHDRAVARSSAPSSHSSRACVLRSGRRVCLRSPPCARGRHCPRRGSRAIAPPGRSCSRQPGSPRSSTGSSAAG